ncbi:MAG: signal peptidase I [Acidobacteriia bacterium]|nr:signal peptidase I [Terriglobia bacterium]
MNEHEQNPAQQEFVSQNVTAAEPPLDAGPGEMTQPVTEAGAQETTPYQVTARHSAPRDLFGTQTFFTVVIFSIFVITFIVQAFQIPSGSMENTLLVGDFLLVDKLHFAVNGGGPRLLPYGTIQRGDIVVFYFPVEPSQFLVKRVIGMPGDHIRLRNKAVYVNGEPLQESYAIHQQRMPDGYRDNFPSQRGYSREIDRHWRYELARYVSDGELVVPADEYFVLGDNRDNSLDSRYWGFVPRANIVGRPLVIYLSVKGPEPDAPDGKLMHSGQTLAHLLQLARWDRTFRLVR